MKIVLAIEYDGSWYHGWQRQKHQEQTVQECLEKAVSIVANAPTQVVCSGRTDARVHASEQIVHIETDVYRSSKSWVFGINCNLPSTIRVKWAVKAPDDFHARFKATARRYRYIIECSPIKSALLTDYVAWQKTSLDVQAMHQGAQFLVGEHDFTSYRAVACQNSTPIKNIHHITVYQEKGFVVIDVQASGFLMHMVRNIAGVLIEVGQGDAKPLWVQEVLVEKDRKKAAKTASPYGLYFVRAYYDDYQLPQLTLGPRLVSQAEDFQEQRALLSSILIAI